MARDLIEQVEDLLERLEQTDLSMEQTERLERALAKAHQTDLARLWAVL